MKERYFTDELLENQATELYQQVAELARKKTRSLTSRHDLHCWYAICRHISWTLPPTRTFQVRVAILDGIVELIKLRLRIGMPFIFTQHINTTRNTGMMSVWWKDLITTENPLAQ